MKKSNQDVLRERLDAIDRETPTYEPLTGAQLIVLVVAAMLIIFLAPKWLPFII